MARSPRFRYRTARERRLTRRRFLAGGAVAAGGLAVAAAALTQGFPSDRGGVDATATPPSAARAAATARPTAIVTPAPAPTPTLAPIDLPPLEHVTVGQLRHALDARQLSARELVGWSLDRIAAMDGGERGLGAVIELNPDALEIARVRDQELAEGFRRGPLHGIPVLVKDLFATADAMATTAGSLALLDNAVGRDAFVVWRLRQAGAILLGKTNLTEWCNFQGTTQTSGWSTRGGQTRNPYRLDRSPWGSSSGSAVAVAAGYATLALGVETDGSIVCPASAAAVVGLKPTVGLTSRAGVIPISFSQDSPGPLARTVEDVAYLLTAIAGFDPEDPAAGDFAWTAPAAAFAEWPIAEPGAVDYTRFLDPDGLRGARIGVARNVFVDADAAKLVEAALPALEAAGAVVVDPVEIPSAGALGPGRQEFEVLITEFPYGLERYLATYAPGGPIWSLADVVAFNEAHAAEELARYDQANFEAALRGGSVRDAWYQTTVADTLALARAGGIDAVLDAHGLDAVIAPTTGAPTPISLGGDDFPGACSQVSAMAGYPILNVPVGYVDGLPVGMSFMGRAFAEGTLLKLAYAFEQAYPVRRPPEFD